MSIPLTQYAKIKNKYCISYYGNCNEYLVQLKLARPYIEKMYPGIQVYLVSKDDTFYLLEDEPRTLKRSQYDKNDFSYTRELNCDMLTHPVESLLNESNVPKISLAINKLGSDICCIYPRGSLPTKSLTDAQIQKTINYVQSQKMTPILNGDLNKAGCVIGVENEYTSLAPIKGVKTILIPTGIGENLYKSLYCNIDIWKID